MSELLIVGDEEHIRSMIRKYGGLKGHKIEEAASGVDTIEKYKQAGYDLIIMGIMMPNLDGSSAVEKIRKDVQTPIVTLSARRGGYDRVHDFGIGIDDYVVKPFSPEELMTRVSTILEQYHSDINTRKKDIYTYGDLKIGFAARKVFIDDERVGVSSKEYVLLFYLVHNEGITLTREQLAHDVWGYDFYGDNRTLDMYTRLPRKSLQDYSRLTITLHGIRYRFEAEK